MTAVVAELPGNPAAPPRDASVMHPSRRPNRPSIAIVLPALDLGGAQISMLRLAAAFRDAGHRVAVATLHDAPAGPGPPPDVELVVLGLERSHAAVPALARFARGWRPDVFLSAMSHVNIAAISAARLSGGRTRAVVTEHAPIRLLADSQGGWKYRVLPAAIRVAYPLAGAVVAVSAGIEQELRRIAPRARRIRRISNPVIDDATQALADAPMERPWPWDGAAPTVLGVGRLAPEKDFATLIDALALVRREVPARLAILGEGAERAALEARVAALGLGGCVFMPGLVANPFAYMGRAAVLALTSRFEGFGNVLVEAMACGARVVATDAPCGPREILDHGRWGALVPVGDAPAVAAAILSALSRPPPPGLRARASSFTTSASAEAYAALIDEVVGR